MSTRLNCVRLMTSLVGLGCLSFTGCGSQSVPVNEISVATSGIEIMDRELALDQQWPGWRGPNGNGVAPDQNVRTNWSGMDDAAWVADVPGRGHSSPTVVGDLVLLAAADDDKQTQMVLAYEKATGDLKWSKEIHQGNFPSSREVHQKATNANSTVACDGEKAYIAFLNNKRITATALDLSGEVVWQKELGAFDSKFGFAPSPILYKSFVIFAADNQGGGFIAALDVGSGEIAWRIARGNTNSHSSPLLANLGGRDQMVIAGCDQVTSYDPATGDELWSTAGTSQTTCGTAIAMDDRIVASGGYPERQTICLSPDGEKLWENKTNIYEPSPVAAGGNIFAVSDDGIAYCWSGEDGDMLWRSRLGGKFSASPVVCNGNVFVSNLAGKTFVFKASPEKYEEVAVNELGSDCYASPAIVNGQVFLRVGITVDGKREERLVCFEQSY